VELCINSPSVLNGIHKDNNLNLQKYRDLSQACVKRICRHYFPHFSEKWQFMPTKCNRDIGVKIAEVGSYLSRYSDERHDRDIVFRFPAREKYISPTRSENDTAFYSIATVVFFCGHLLAGM
jgi:hypothetical protein